MTFLARYRLFVSFRTFASIACTSQHSSCSLSVPQGLCLRQTQAILPAGSSSPSRYAPFA